MDQHDSHTPAWTVFTAVSFVAAITMAALGIFALPLGLWERGYMGITALFLVHASVSLTKTLRDRHEARILAERSR